MCTHKRIFLIKLFFAFANWCAFIFVVFSCIFIPNQCQNLQMSCFYFLPLSYPALCVYGVYFPSLIAFNLYVLNQAENRYCVSVCVRVFPSGRSLGQAHSRMLHTWASFLVPETCSLECI